MTKNKMNYLALGALNILTIGLPFMAQAKTAMNLASTEKTELFNQASIKAIASSWLKVPAACKARGFNASPTTLEFKTASLEAQNIYNQF